eukprot:11993875-Karenia_brevis.AAC.1
MKVLLPSRRDGGGRGFPQMHCETSIYDGTVNLTGSPNLTHNAMECNKEHLYRISDERVAVKLCADFESDWEKSTTVTQSIIDTMMTKHRGRSRAQSEGSNDRTT